MQKLIFGNTEVAIPTSFKIDKKKNMSNNAGRTANGEYVGDIKCIKTTLHIEWSHLKPDEIRTINSFVSNVGKMFFDVTYLDETFNEVTKTFFAEDTAYEQWGWDSHRQFCKVLSVDLVEK